MVPVTLQFWNYDKMLMLGEYNIDFKGQSKHTWQFFQENLELSIEKPAQENNKNSEVDSRTSELSNMKDSGAKTANIKPKTVEPGSAKLIKSISRKEPHSLQTIPIPPLPSKKVEEGDTKSGI